MSGKWFNAISYDVDKKTELLDYDLIEKKSKISNIRCLLASFYPDRGLESRRDYKVDLKL